MVPAKFKTLEQIVSIYIQLNTEKLGSIKYFEDFFHGTLDGFKTNLSTNSTQDHLLINLF